MRDMPVIPKQQLQCMRPRGQSELRFGLPGAEMQMVLVVWDRLVERGQIGVDQQMVMAGIRSFDPRGRDSHPV